MAKVAGRDEARTILEGLAAQASLGRLPGWSPAIGLVLEGKPWVVCRLTESALRIADWGAGVEPETTIAMTYEGVDGWLVRGVDFTHLVKAGEFKVVSGTYFDLLLLSKVLRLRPENYKGIAA